MLSPAGIYPARHDCRSRTAIPGNVQPRELPVQLNSPHVKLGGGVKQECQNLAPVPTNRPRSAGLLPGLPFRLANPTGSCSAPGFYPDLVLRELLLVSNTVFISF